MLLILIALFTPQDEKTVAEAARATVEKGSFTLQITPTADLKDALPADRASVAGVNIVATQLKDGTFLSTDGTTEFIGREKSVLMKTPDGWRSAGDVVRELIEDITSAVGKDEGSRGNVTKAKAAYRRLIAIAQLAVRSLPPTQHLAKIEGDFKGLKKGATEVIDGKRCQVYEGDLKELAAQMLLQGPYEQMVKDGSLTITEMSGRGRVWVAPDGLVRRTKLEAVGKYSVLKEDKTRKVVPVSVAVSTDVLKIGETTKDVPQEVTDKLKAMAAATDK
jgi:hypothetical protein